MAAFRGVPQTHTQGRPNTRTGGLDKVRVGYPGTFPVGSPGSSSSSGFPGGPMASGGVPSGASSSGVNLQAQTNPYLEALQSRYSGYMDKLEGGTSRAMDIAGTKIRDAREGGRRALSEGETIRGVGSSPAMSRYEGETQRQVTGGLTDLALGREGMMGDALRGGLGIASAPGEMALREKQLKLSAEATRQAADQANFQRWMALLNAQRNSPLNPSTYTGAGF